MGVWREEDHPRGYHGHFVSKVSSLGSALFDATKAAGTEAANRIKQLGNALAGTAMIVPSAVGIYYSTLFGRVYFRPIDPGAQARKDYGKLPPKLKNLKDKPDWLENFSVETWNHILDGHAPESTVVATDKFPDGRTETLTQIILDAIPLSEPKLKNGSTQFFITYYNGEKVRTFVEYQFDTGKWDITSVHPYPIDIITNHFGKRR